MQPPKNLVEDYRRHLPSSASSDLEIGRYATEEGIERLLQWFQGIPCQQLGKVCLVIGTGGLPKKTYVDLGRTSGLQMLWCSSLLPMPFRFIPSYRGLVKIEDPSKLTQAFSTLSAQSTAILYVLDAGLEQDFVAAAQCLDRNRIPDLIVKDPEFLIYLVDEDRDDSPSGMVEVLCLGKRGPWNDLLEL